MKSLPQQPPNKIRRKQKNKIKEARSTKEKKWNKREGGWTKLKGNNENE